MIKIPYTNENLLHRLLTDDICFVRGWHREHFYNPGLLMMQKNSYHNFENGIFNYFTRIKLLNIRENNRLDGPTSIAPTVKALIFQIRVFEKPLGQFKNIFRGHLPFLNL